MKKNYTLKTVLTLVLFIASYCYTNAQVRILEVDPSTDRVKFKNFGGSSVDISSYRLCAKFDYAGSAPLSSMTLLSGNLNLAPNAEVEITSAVDLDEAFSDFCLYLGSGSFGSPAAMVDFVQWGSGGNGRESVAVSKGIWTAGTFVQVAPPYEYIGNGTQNGTAQWETLLGIEDFTINNLKLYPNPVNSELQIFFNNTITNGSAVVFNIIGKQVLTQGFSGLNSAIINTSELSQGVYLVKINSDQGSITRRIIKQ